MRSYKNNTRRTRVTSLVGVLLALLETLLLLLPLDLGVGNGALCIMASIIELLQKSEYSHEPGHQPRRPGRFRRWRCSL
jgi:hypothetical protein